MAFESILEKAHGNRPRQQYLSKITLRFEARTQERLEEIQKIVLDELEKEQDK